MRPALDLQIRRLEPKEWPAAFPLVVQLRPHLSEAEFLRRVQRQGHGGYELIGAFADGMMIGLLGIRPVHTLMRGYHLHIDDIVVDETRQRTGVGHALMAYAEADAAARGMTAVFLDARPVAIAFYELNGYQLHRSPSMMKKLSTETD
jgi:GNAT superfamily N-acetyltransferase